MKANAIRGSLPYALGLGLLSLSALAASGCGNPDDPGGSSVLSSTGPTQAPGSASSSGSGSTSDPNPGTVSGPPSSELEPLRSEMLTAINNARAVARSCGGQPFPAAPPLSRDPILDSVAQQHSAEMAAQNYFSHTGLDGSSPFQRMQTAGYKYQTASENIAAGSATVDATVQQWLSDQEHCANLMSATFTKTGFGYGYSDTATYKYYWTADFAAPL